MLAELKISNFERKTVCFPRWLGSVCIQRSDSTVKGKYTENSWRKRTKKRRKARTKWKTCEKQFRATLKLPCFMYSKAPSPPHFSLRDNKETFSDMTINARGSWKQKNAKTLVDFLWFSSLINLRFFFHSSVGLHEDRRLHDDALPEHCKTIGNNVARSKSTLIGNCLHGRHRELVCDKK